MNKVKHKETLKKLVNNSFPKLKRGKTLLLGTNIGKYSGGIFWILPYVRVILINPKTEKLDNKQLTGLLAHELSHFETPKRYRLIFYWIIPRVRKIIETETDQLAIRKGYGKELYEWRRNFDEEIICLSSKEIKEYAKSIGKW